MLLTRDNNSSLFESSIRLTTSSFQQNIMFRQAFSHTFNKVIWQQISRLSPNQFLLQQQHLLNALLNDEEKFLSQFRLFYNNHLILYEWHVLATEKYLEIKDYVFTKLLKKTTADYKSILKDNMNKLAKSSMKKQSSKHSNNLKYSANFFLRSRNQTPKPSLLKMKKSCQSLPNSIHHSSIMCNSPYESNKQNVKSIEEFPTHHQPTKQFSQDYHELFIKTLDACDGFKYIHYDFCRHQKGYENRNIYNQFIRGKRRNNSSERLKTFYEELRQQEQEKENNYLGQRSNIFNKTLSFLKPAAVHNGSKYANFEIVPFDKNQQHTNADADGENRRSHFKRKGFKSHVMKKMPHHFGKQKKPSAFLTKMQKSAVLVQRLST